jgi:integrase/recombinase XerD
MANMVNWNKDDKKEPVYNTTGGAVYPTDLTADIISKVLSEKGATGLTASQLRAIKNSMETTLAQYNIEHGSVGEDDIIGIQENNAHILKNFINAKRIEGRSNTTLYNYGKEITKFFLSVNKPLNHITTQDIRDYLSWRKITGGLQAVSVQNIRTYMLSFFKWCYAEELITNNPMSRIGVIKTEKHVVQVLSDEEQEIIRCACKSERDLAIVDLLSGSGMRVSELCGLNKSDIDFDKGEVVVFGKGAKERMCFLTGKSKVHLKWYIDSRTDDNPALFVTTNKPYERLTKNGIEYILKHIAKDSKVPTCRLYPHKYRSTLATNMIIRGANAEQVQGVLGHSSVNTTLQCYVKSDVDGFKRAHDQFIN